eukprot:6176416-Pleurochrysis_carterae.AAC.3
MLACTYMICDAICLCYCTASCACRLRYNYNSVLKYDGYRRAGSCTDMIRRRIIKQNNLSSSVLYSYGIVIPRSWMSISAFKIPVIIICFRISRPHLVRKESALSSKS